jgi:hypothetical protein
VPAQRIVRELELVALAHEHPEGTLEVARRGRRVGEAAPQQGERGLELGGVVLLTDGGGDQLGIDPERPQLALDPLGAPAVEASPVVREALGVAGVVQVALLEQLAHDCLDRLGVDALARQGAGKLGDRPVTPVERAPRQVAGVLDALLGIFGERPQAAATSGTGGGVASGSRSIGCTRSWFMPSAS